ncbi:hypothetical protein GJAV_G00008360 [Gymnothorax javanicus]|nr:hypothetical protein GJAV_G00008360 [Gymnothorax javanicus]
MDSSRANRFVVVTQVYPQQSATVAPAVYTSPHQAPQVTSLLGKFLKGEPKALGIVQIMIGMMSILLGICMAISADSIGVFSGIVFWGALFFISSGALSVAASDKLNKCRVKGALVMNIFSTITAGIAIILFSLDLVIEIRYHSCYYTDDLLNTSLCEDLRLLLKARSHGIIGVLLVLSILEFIVSICVSAAACKVLCDTDPVSEQVMYIPHPNNQYSNFPPGNPIPAPSTYETAVPQVLGQSVMNEAEKHTERPPAYAAVIP